MKVDTNTPRSLFQRFIVHWHELRWNLIGYFVALTILPIAIVIALTLVRNNAQVKQQIFNQLESVADLKQDQIIQWLQNSTTTLGLLPSGNNPLLDAFVAAPEADQQMQEAVNQLLSQYKDAQTSFEEFFIYDVKGQIIASSNPIQIGKIVINQPFFRPSLGRTVIQPPSYEVGSGDLTIFITHPLLNTANGQIMGVLAGRLDTTMLGQIMTNRTGLGDSGETYLVSLENNYLLTPSRFESEGYLPNRAYHSAGIDRALKAENGADSYEDYRDPTQRVLGVYRWIPELQVGMLAESHEATILAPLRQTNIVNITIGVFAAVISAAIGLYKAARISRPIMDLTASAEKLAAGDLNQSVEIKEHNEIGRLAGVFNTMTIQLRQTQEVLEQRVVERTAELEQTVNQLQHALNLHDQLRATIRALDIPIVPIQDGILIMSLIGEFDRKRSDEMMQSLLAHITHERADLVVMDVTGISRIDQQFAQVLVDGANAVKLLGAQVILVGMRPELCKAIIDLEIDLSNLVIKADLQGGVTYAIEHYHRKHFRKAIALG